ncbi:MAG: NAD(+) diphosphatase [bacterium]|nr:NAD(+) diphosphatase [bacterium]
MTFLSNFKPPANASETALWLLFHDQLLLMRREGDSLSIPNSAELEIFGLGPTGRQFLGMLNDHPCYVGELTDAEQISDPFTFTDLWALFGRFEEDVIRAAGLANQLVQWNQNHRYCGKCGNPTENKTDERAKICPKCGLINYPRLSPAIIVAVRKDNQLLLANAQRFPAKLYSVLAGFVEPGETLEECVRREVREEVGIAVKNVRYFGSEPWPFPDSLMVAFTAEYDSGEIRIDETEIAEAGWFSADNLPDIPPKFSIARQLIDWFSEDEQN